MRFPKDKAPFDKGSLLHYPGAVYRGGKFHDPDWKAIEPFTATLHLVEMHRGRSAAYFEWCDEAGNKYPMFMSDMFEVAKRGIGDGGRVFARWIVKKRGQNYGVGLAKDELSGTK